MNRRLAPTEDPLFVEGRAEAVCFEILARSRRAFETEVKRDCSPSSDHTVTYVAIPLACDPLTTGWVFSDA
jgi:hypothetical protein